MCANINQIHQNMKKLWPSDFFTSFWPWNGSGWRSKYIHVIILMSTFDYYICDFWVNLWTKLRSTLFYVENNVYQCEYCVWMWDKSDHKIKKLWPSLMFSDRQRVDGRFPETQTSCYCWIISLSTEITCIDIIWFTTSIRSSLSNHDSN